MTSYAGPPVGDPWRSGVEQRRAGAAATRRVVARGAPSPVTTRDQGVEQDADPAAAGVDDAGLAEHLELVRCASQRLCSLGRGRPDDVGEIAAVVGAAVAAAAASRSTVSIVPSTGSPTAA